MVWAGAGWLGGVDWMHRFLAGGGVRWGGDRLSAVLFIVLPVIVGQQGVKHTEGDEQIIHLEWSPVT